VGLEILKYLFGLSDEQLFENFYLYIRYKIALGMQDITQIKKRGRGYSGYSTNIKETANPDNDIQMITNVHTDKNIHSNKEFLEEFAKLKEKTDMKTLIVDGGYAAEENREQAQAEGVEIIETGIRGRKSA